jgi:Arc/MetJ family transcription regulator
VVSMLFMMNIVRGKYVVGRQIFVDRHLVDRLLSKYFRRHDTSSTQHFVDKHFVEIFSSTRHFVDTTFRRQTFRRHDTSSTRHFVDTTFRRQTFRRHDTSSTRHFVDTTFRRHDTSSKFFC